MIRSSHAALLVFVLGGLAAAAHAQGDRPVVRINPPGSAASAPAQTEPAYRPAEREQAGRNENGCSCAGNNRCYHSLDFNYCVARDGHRVYIQRFWGQ